MEKIGIIEAGPKGPAFYICAPKVMGRAFEKDKNGEILCFVKKTEING